MGCDIHCYAEKKVNGKWEKIGKAFPNQWYNPDQESRVDPDGYEWNARYTDKPYNGRNYDLFAILADVRNGTGFAGVKTGAGFNPISNPKGLPEDVTNEVKKASDGWGLDGHSHSFLTLKELEEYDWNQITVKYGVVDIDEYKRAIETSEPPERYCSYVSGGGVQIVEPEVIDTIIANPKKGRKNISYYTKMEWGTTYREAAGKHFFKAIDLLKEHGEGENVRIVFWFDN